MAQYCGKVSSSRLIECMGSYALSFCKTGFVRSGTYCTLKFGIFICYVCYLYCSLLWKLAPAKLSLFPSTIKSHLFPQYHGLSRPQSSSQAKIVVKLPVENDAASHSRKQSARIGSVYLRIQYIPICVPFVTLQII